MKSSNENLVLCFHVDDGLVMETLNKVEHFMDMFAKQFDMIIDEVNTFLGIEIKILENGAIILNQKNYTQRILRKFGMFNANPTKLPIDVGWTQINSPIAKNFKE